MAPRKRSAISAGFSQLQDRPKAKKAGHALLMDGNASSKHSKLDATTLGAGKAPPRGTAEAVFLTTELLEQILYHLPDKQLLVTQRKLFFHPADVSLGWKYDDLTEDWITLSGVTLGEARRQGTAVVPAGVLNPMLFQQSEPLELGPPPLYAKHPQAIVYWSTFKNLGSSMHHPQASWRRMYLTQPPSVYAAFQGASRKTSVRQSDGVKGATVYEAGLALGQQLKWSFHWDSMDVNLYGIMM